LKNAVYYTSVRFEVYMAVTMKNAVLWDEPHCLTSQKTAVFIILVFFAVYFGC
jgi:hypothetical protein